MFLLVVFHNMYACLDVYVLFDALFSNAHDRGMKMLPLEYLEYIVYLMG